MLSEEDRQAAVDTVKRFNEAMIHYHKTQRALFNVPERPSFFEQASEDNGIDDDVALQKVPVPNLVTDDEIEAALDDLGYDTAAKINPWVSERGVAEERLLKSIEEKEANKARDAELKQYSKKLQQAMKDLHERYKENLISHDDMMREKLALSTKYLAFSGSSIEPDNMFTLWKLQQKVIDDFLTDNCSFPASYGILSLLNADDPERVTVVSPDTVDIVLSQSPRRLSTGVTQLIVIKVADRWKIDGIHETHPLTKSISNISRIRVPSPREEEKAGGWVKFKPQPVKSQPPVINVEEAYHFLRGQGSGALRLHPRRKAGLDPLGSKIGGSIAWPLGEPFPVCPERRCPAVPVLQLHQRDAPELPFMPGTDLFQLLWYPQNYHGKGIGTYFGPKILGFWRDSSTLGWNRALRPIYDLYEYLYVVQECEVHPEWVIEYPDIDELPPDQQMEIISHYLKRPDGDDDYIYSQCLSIAPGFKVGGYPSWSARELMGDIFPADPDQKYLLTIDAMEWQSGSEKRWRPTDRQISEHSPTGICSIQPINIFLNTNTTPWTVMPNTRF
ncbi:MAG: hypothetical protein ACAI35_07105 [Candidatus Methylacidiphilales bacterium]